MTTVESHDARVARLGIHLPEPGASAGAYQLTSIDSGYLFVAGQIGRKDGDFIRGRCGEDRDIAAARDAAERSAAMVISQIRLALNGSLNRVRRVMRLGVFVNSAPDFTEQVPIADAASDLMIAVFGEAGRHVRTTIGTSVLPLNGLVEIDAIVSLNEEF